ncbi:DinB family protein [Pedobacter nutrimenti]|uniref:DinB family protein n=1 Tax=Pedobacter nutrimenti TaxID=1241337 RepID=UPI00292ECA73|nr:DinB family protein [Pedobacter nutrimenti]
MAYYCGAVYNSGISTGHWERTYYHPGNNEYMPIWQMVNQYNWHGAHHAEQIISLRKRMGW